MISQITNTSQGIMFLLLLGMGSIIGMFVIAMLLSIPFRSLKTTKLQQVILYVVGVISIGFGISLFFIT